MSTQQCKQPLRLPGGVGFATWSVVGARAFGDSFSQTQQMLGWHYLQRVLGRMEPGRRIRSLWASRSPQQPRSWLRCHPSPVAASLPFGEALEGSRSSLLCRSACRTESRTREGKSKNSSRDGRRANRHRRTPGKPCIRRISGRAAGCRLSRYTHHPLP